MVRENRIKEINFADNGDWSGTNTFSAAGSTVIGDVFSKGINGEILEVDVNFDRAGSFSLSVSGLNIEFWRNNSPSGTTWLHTQPREFSSSTTGSIANAEHVPFVINGPIYLSAGSVASGTKPFSLTVKYR